MSRLEDLQPNTVIRGILPDEMVTLINVQWYGSDAVEITYKDSGGRVGNEIRYRDNESELELVKSGRPWSFDGDGGLFRLVAEAHRIRLAHLFDPVMAVHTSQVEPLPHQITAVYETMLPRQPLRFLLADDPGAGKTIMSGLLIKELIARGDVQRCLVVCPGSLVEQWRKELDERFHLPFEIMTQDRLDTARSGNGFLENPLVIARLDQLSRNPKVQEKLKIPDCRWDLVICDEAHKMSATFFGGEIKYTQRYRLGQLLSTLTRHFLLLTATPHNGKETDFQLFMALLDSDRFEGRFRDGVHATDASDLMRRMVKEKLLKFDATPLFPERIAHTVPYRLSAAETRLYQAVTDYVREEFNRAKALEDNRRATVGFALTVLQRRLASSPEAISESLRRRRERLEQQLGKLTPISSPAFDPEDLENLEDAPDQEFETAEQEILNQATAARTVQELQAEIATLKRLEALAVIVRHSGEDRKWRELEQLLREIFMPIPLADPTIQSPRQKLVIFTEHRDTLSYLEQRITNLLGRKNVVLHIHGGISRDQRRNAQEAFQHDPAVQILVATDAAGEGINLQCAHLMVNYDLPWNPNRLEQRFGRIHRIGQTEVCHLWNLVAEGTREGDVYCTLLHKLEQARQALGGQVFDVLGKLQFEGKSLRELLIEAVRYGEQPDVRDRLNQVVADAVDGMRLRDLLEDRAIAHDVMDVSRVQRVRAEMERAEARRLQPHYMESFFLRAFKELDGMVKPREPHRHEITRVPATIRARAQALPSRYERIAFEKALVAPENQPLAAFICPGHPLLDATLDLTLERHRDLLKRGAVLVDEGDDGQQPRVIFHLEHAIRDASLTRTGERRVISKRMLYVELDSVGNTRHLHYAPYLDYRPLAVGEPEVSTLLARPECAWIDQGLEQRVQGYAIAEMVPEHLAEVRSRKLSLIAKTEVAVRDRLTKEIDHWSHRTEELKLQEQAGKFNARLNSTEARKRAEALEFRLRQRMAELKQERQMASLPPIVIGGFLVVPAGLLATMNGGPAMHPAVALDTQAAAARARAIVMAVERDLGFEPVDRELDKIGYDIESLNPVTGKLRFIEVKGRQSGADTITVTRNEILYSLNKPEDFILALVEFGADGTHRARYLRRPFQREPDFGVTSVNYRFAELLARAEEPA